MIKELFLIPCGRFFGLRDTACSLAFAPQRKRVMLVDGNAAAHISSLISEGKCAPEVEKMLEGPSIGALQPKSDDISSIQILLNERCNFRCSYCYSADSRCNIELAEPVLKSAISWLRQCAINTRREHIALIFVGGGEPMLSWTLIKAAVEYAQQLSAHDGIRNFYKIVTNGSLLSNEQLEFIKRYDLAMQVSFEILPDVQNAQRKHFDDVSANIMKLGEFSVDTRIRSTITDLNVQRMAEMVHLSLKQYPFIKKLAFEPVVDPDLFNSADKMRSFAYRYFESFKTARMVAQNNGIDLSSSLSRTWRTIRKHFCGPICSLSPNGSLTGCSHFSSDRIAGFDQFKYGEVKPDKVNISRWRFEEMFKSKHQSECENCWLQFNCAGGCPNHRFVYSKEVFDEICELRRNICLYELLIELAEKYSHTAANDFWSDIPRRLS